MTNKYTSIATFLRLAVLITTVYFVGHAANFLYEAANRSRLEMEIEKLRERNINVYLYKLGYHE